MVCRWLAVFVPSLCVVLAFGCAPEAREGERRTLGSKQQAIGNGTQDFFNLHTAVVRVNVQGRGNCSGVLVTPLYVLTANHCVTGTHREGFECLFADGPGLGNLSVNATVGFQFCNSNTASCVDTPIVSHTFPDSGQLIVQQASSVDLCPITGDIDNVARDIALIRLDNRVPLSLTPPAHPAILGNPNLTFSGSCLASHNPDDFIATAVGFGRTSSVAGAGESGNDDRDRHYKQTEDWFRTDGILRNEWLATSTYEGSLGGDSGGGLFADRLCGILSRHVPVGLPPGVSSDAADLENSSNQAFLQANILDVSQTHFAGECNPDDPNPWDDPTLTDTDTGEVTFEGAARGDGMPDACDPCPFESESDLRGDFTRGDDLDQDGVPDRCDNCPPSICDARGLAAKFCANPYPDTFGPQADLDGDRIGDVCDSCPSVPNPSDNLQPNPTNPANPNSDDPDADYVGRACDTCDQPNSWKACKTDTECTLTRTDGTVVPGVCLEIGTYGQCDDAEGRICRPEFANKDCKDGVTCEFFPQFGFGRCSQVLDDVNGNGQGGPCDNCDAAPGATVFANSNRFAEEREFAPPLGDACDPVPAYSARATPDLFPGIIRLIGAAGVGLDADAGYTGQVFDADVGFRWTNCHVDPGSGMLEDVPARDCYFLHSTVDPGIGFDPQPSFPSTWRRVTTGFADFFAFGSGLFTGTPTDQNVSRTFDSVVRPSVFNHPFGHEYNEDEALRVGRLENIVWYHETDIQLGRVTTFPNPIDGKPNSTGLFWSHTLFDGATFASSRDQQYITPTRSLRDHYGYVKTPLVADPFGSGFKEFAECNFGPCGLKWRGDMLARINPSDIILPAVGAGRVQPGVDGSFGVIGWFGIANVTSWITPAVGTLMDDPALAFVTVAETGIRAAPFSGGLQGIVVPKNWFAAAVPNTLVATSGKIVVGDRRVDQAIAAAAVPSGPSAREQPAYVASGRQSALYMVGGSASGTPTGEIWRYDIGDEQWARVLGRGFPTGSDKSAPRHVLAAGLDTERNQLAFIDEAPIGKTKLKLARVVVFDTAHRTGKVLLTLPRLGVHSRIDLTARGDGTWVLTAQLGKSKVWVAYRFRIDSDNKLDWLGLRIGQGKIFDQPVNDTSGVVLFVMDKNAPRALLLDSGSFKPSKHGCAAL